VEYALAALLAQDIAGKEAPKVAAERLSRKDAVFGVTNVYESLISGNPFRLAVNSGQRSFIQETEQEILCNAPVLIRSCDRRMLELNP
jgi:hypothetical protein